MTITLLAVSLNEHPLSQPITASFDARGGTIGRADHNTMALPDPERHISRLQAEVQANGPQYSIKNVGAANPIGVAGRQLAAGETAQLAHGDEVRIGGYLLRVIDDAQGDGSGAAITQGRARVTDNLAGLATDPSQRARAASPPPAPPPPPVGPRTSSGAGSFGLADMVTPMSSGNPFADLLGSPPSPPQGYGGQTPSAKVAAPTDPFADLMAPPSGISSQSGALSSATAAHDSGQLPHDFDPFAASAPAPRPAAPPVSSDPFADLMPAASNASIDAMFGLQAGPDHGDPLARFASDMPSPGQPRQESDVSTDPMAMFGAPAAAPAPAASTRRDHTPDLNAAFVPPQWSNPMAAPPRSDPDPGNQIPSDVTWLRPKPRSASAAPPVVEPPAPAASQPSALPITSQPLAPSPQAVPLGAASPSGFVDEVVPFDLLMPAASPGAPSALTDFELGPAVAMPATPPSLAPAAAGLPYPTAPAAPSHQAADADVLWQAFCEGVGAPIRLNRPLDTDTMRVLGQLLNAAVAGTLQLVAVRAATKTELRADVTLIQQRANNPLKFTPDPHAGLEQLVNPPMRGFMHGPAAMTDAMNDLVGHAIGTMAGMRAALDGVLERFAPGELEGKLTGKSMLDSVLPMNRKARLWDLYLQHFATIREEAQEDFQSLFGKAFLAAYEEQLDKLRQSGAPKPK